MVYSSVQILADSTDKVCLSDASGKLGVSLEHRSPKDTHHFSSTEIKQAYQFILTQEKSQEILMTMKTGLFSIFA